MFQNNLRLDFASRLMTRLFLWQGIITPEEMAIADQTTEPKIRQLLTFIKWASAKTEDGAAHGTSKRRAYIPSSESIDRMTKSCSVKGNGLMMGVVGKRCKFYIYTEPHAMLDLHIEIKGPRNEICSEKIMSIYPTRRMSQLLNAADVNVATSNEVKYVDDGKGNAYFRQKSIENMDEEEKKIPFDYQCLGKGKYLVSYVPRSSGEHKVSVVSHGNQIPGSPFTAKIAESVGHLEKQFSRERRAGIFFEKCSDSVDSGRSIDSFERENPPNPSCLSAPRTTGSYPVTHQQSLGTRTAGLNGRLSKQGTVTRRRVLRRVVTRGGNEVSLDDSGRYTALNRQAALSISPSSAKTSIPNISVKPTKSGASLQVPDATTKKMSEKCPAVVSEQRDREHSEVLNNKKNDNHNKIESGGVSDKDPPALLQRRVQALTNSKLTEGCCARTESYAQSMVDSAMQSAYDSLKKRRCSRQKCVDFEEGNPHESKDDDKLSGIQGQGDRVETTILDTLKGKEILSGDTIMFNTSPESTSVGETPKSNNDTSQLCTKSRQEAELRLDNAMPSSQTINRNSTHSRIPSDDVLESSLEKSSEFSQTASEDRKLTSELHEHGDTKGRKLFKQISSSTKSPPDSPSLKLLQSQSLNKVCYYISQRAITHSIRSLQSQTSEGNLLVVNTDTNSASAQRGRIMAISEQPLSLEVVDEPSNALGAAESIVFVQAEDDTSKGLSPEKSLGATGKVLSLSSTDSAAAVIVVPTTNRRRGSLVRQDVTMLQKLSEESSPGSEKSVLKENQLTEDGSVRAHSEEEGLCFPGSEAGSKDNSREETLPTRGATGQATEKPDEKKATGSQEGDITQEVGTSLGRDTCSSQRDKQLSWSLEKGTRQRREDDELTKADRLCSNEFDGETLATTRLCSSSINSTAQSAFTRQTQQSSVNPEHRDEGFNTIVDISCDPPSSPTWYSSQMFIRIPTPKVDKWTQITYDEIKQETGWVSPRSTTRQRKLYKQSAQVHLNMEPQEPCEESGARSPLSVWYGDNLPQIVYEPASEATETNSFIGSDHSHYDVHQWLQDNREEMCGLQPVRQSTVETVDSGIADSRCSSPGRLWRRQHHSIPNPSGHKPVCRHPYQGQIDLDPRLLRSASNSPSGDEEKENQHRGKQRKSQSASASHRQIGRTTSDGKRPRTSKPCREDSCSLSDTELCKCSSPRRDGQLCGRCSQGEEQSSGTKSREKASRKNDTKEQRNTGNRLKCDQQKKQENTVNGMTASQSRKMKFRRRSFALVDSDSECSVEKDCVDFSSLTTTKICESKGRRDEESPSIGLTSACSPDVCDVSARRRSYGGTPTVKKREIQMQRSSTLNEESYCGFGLSMSHRDDLLSQINSFSNLYEKHVHDESDRVEMEAEMTTPENDSTKSPSSLQSNVAAGAAGDSPGEFILTSDSDFLDGSPSADYFPMSRLSHVTDSCDHKKEDSRSPPDEESCETSNPIRELFDMLVRYQEDLTSASDDGDLGMEPIEIPDASYTNPIRCRAIGPGLQTGTVGTKLFFQVSYNVCEIFEIIDWGDATLSPAILTTAFSRLIGREQIHNCYSKSVLACAKSVLMRTSEVYCT